MRSKLLLLPLAGALLVLSGCEIEDWDAGGRRTKDFHSTHPLSAGGRVSVEGFNGSIEISTWEQSSVDVSGTKTAPTDDLLDALKIDVQTSAQSVSIRAIRPSGLRGNLGVKFVLKVPRGAIVDRVTTSNGSVAVHDATGPARLKSSNGSIRVENLAGDLDAQTSNSRVEVANIAGNAYLRTSNGSVQAEDVSGTLDANTSNSGVKARLSKATGRTVRIETSNGGVELTLPAAFKSDVRVSTNNSGITLHLPEATDAHVSARTSNSAITSDFEVQTTGERTKSHLEGTIGRGGPLLDLSTSNGSIRLQRHM